MDIKPGSWSRPWLHRSRHEADLERLPGPFAEGMFDARSPRGSATPVTELGSTPLIRFRGSAVHCRLVPDVEGGPPGPRLKTKAMMLRDPALFGALLERLGWYACGLPPRLECWRCCQCSQLFDSAGQGRCRACTHGMWPRSVWAPPSPTWVYQVSASASVISTMAPGWQTSAAVMLGVDFG